MKRMLALLLCMALLASLTACGCEHQWADANCLEPQTCTLCGETEGEALGHSWTDATCDTPKTCSACAQTEGDALGHNWEEATCDAPKTCSVCAATEGEALGHTWQEATTEAPKTCLVCATTEGERIITDPRFTTAACSPLFGDWSGQLALPAAAVVGGSAEGEVVYDVIFTFGNDGTMIQQTSFADWDSAKYLFVDSIILSLYMEYMFMGMDNPAAEQDIMDRYGMTMEEYARAYLDSIDPGDTAGSTSMVYYVEGDSLNYALAWEDEMEADRFTLEGDTLTLIPLLGDPIVLTKITE